MAGPYSIRMQFDIDAEPTAVTRALTTVEGVSSWWSDRVEGEPGNDGGDLYVSFPDLPQPMHFSVALGDGQIGWETEEFPPWWDGTTIRWTVGDDPDGEGVDSTSGTTGSTRTTTSSPS